MMQGMAYGTCEAGGNEMPLAGGSAMRLSGPAALFLFLVASLIFPEVARAQVSYVARFALEKQAFLLGEPIFCRFTILNTGTRTFAFSYRTPTRVLNPELETEPRFSVTDETGGGVSDPAPRPCGGARGSAVYGSVTLPPGQEHSERWLLNQWARFVRAGRYRVRAERRLPLSAAKSAPPESSQPPLAYALAINELSFEVMPATEQDLQAAFQSYVKVLEDRAARNPAEAVLVVTTLPQPFLLEKLVAMATAPARESRWDRQQALEGLARLGTRAAWEAILRIARGEPGQRVGASENNALRAYAILLLGQKSDVAFLPALLELASTAPNELRGDVLRALGSFNDLRANQILFERLHSSATNDRVNAILGLKNLESKNAIPALLAMLNDPDAQVRQVAHFALQSLTGQKFKLSRSASRSESARMAARWHAWWREHGATFVIVRQPPCQDW